MDKKPLTLIEEECIAYTLLLFFTKDLNTHNDFLEKMSNIRLEHYTPFTGMDYLRYYQKLENGFKEVFLRPGGIWGYLYHIERIMFKYLSIGLMFETERSGPTFKQGRYVSMFYKTKLENKNTFWLGEALGSKFLADIYRPYIYRVTGVGKKNGRPGVGTAFRANNNFLITARHVVADMDNIVIFDFDNNPIKYDAFMHYPKDDYDTRNRNLDLALVPLVNPSIMARLPYFGPAYIFDKTIALGFPALLGIREHTYFAQSGEVSAIGTLTHGGFDSIIISSISRPGNSGGPVVSEKGYIIGITIHASSEYISNEKESNETNTEGLSNSFNCVLASSEICTFIKAMMPDANIDYENFE